jgi:hypothetical protein
MAVKQILKDFFINPFWKSWSILIFLILALLANGTLWYIFTTKMKENSNPFIFASGLIALNLILANYLFSREKLASYFLLIIALVVQIFMLAFVKYLIILY